MTHQKISNWLLAAIAVVFALYFVSLACCLRPAGDDFALATLLRQKGFIGATLYNFHMFNFRHVPILIFNSLFSISSFDKAYTLVVPLFILTIYCILIFSMAAIARMLLFYAYNKQLSFLQSCCYAMLFVVTLYFNTFQSIEVWAFLNVLLYTLVPVAFAVMGLALLLSSQSKPSRGKTTLLIACSVIAGSGFENFSAGLLLFLFCLTIVRYKNDTDFFRQKLNRQLLLIFFSLLFSSVIVYLAPGTISRPRLEQQFTHAGATFFLWEFLWQKKTVLALLLFVAWFFTGASFGKIVTASAYKKILRWTFFLALIFGALTAIVSQIAFHDAIPARAWFAMNAAAASLIVLLVLYGGAFLFQTKKMLPISLAVLFLFSVLYCGVHIPQLWRYAHHYDARIAQLKQHHTQETLYLDPLPPSGVMVCSELSADTGQYINAITQSAYGLNFAIAVKK